MPHESKLVWILYTDCEMKSMLHKILILCTVPWHISSLGSIQLFTSLQEYIVIFTSISIVILQQHYRPDPKKIMKSKQGGDPNDVHEGKSTKSTSKLVISSHPLKKLIFGQVVH